MDLPDRLADLFVVLTLQNGGLLSKAKRDRHFAMITDDELIALGAAVRDAAHRFDVDRDTVETIARGHRAEAAARAVAWPSRAGTLKEVVM